MAKPTVTADRSKDSKSRLALIKVIKNSRVSTTLKNSFVKHIEIVGHYYLESPEHLEQLGNDLIKLGERIKEAKDIV